MLGCWSIAQRSFDDHAKHFGYLRADLSANIGDIHSLLECLVRPISRFEDLRAWQQARKLHLMIRKITASTTFKDDWSLRNQLRRSSNSAMANIAEGFNRFGTAEFCHFLSIAKGSCGETQSHLYAALDAGFISSEVFTEAYGQAQTVIGLVTRLRTAIKSTNLTGPKTRQNSKSETIQR